MPNDNDADALREWLAVADAAEWIGKRTGEPWTVARVLDACQRQAIALLDEGRFVGRDPVTLLRAPPPVGVLSVRSALPMAGEPTPAPSRPQWRAAALRYTQVRELLVAGWTRVVSDWTEPERPNDDDFRPANLAPVGGPFVIELARVGFWRADLLTLAAFIERRAAEPTKPAKPAGKRWTPEALAELGQRRERDGTKAAAEWAGISEARLRKLLPSDRPTVKALADWPPRQVKPKR